MEDKSQNHSDDVARKFPKRRKRLTVQVRYQTFETMEPMTLLSFLSDLKLACNTDGLHHGGFLKLFHLFMRKSARAVQNACTGLKPTKYRRQAEGTLTTYYEVVVHLLSAYAMKDAIAETEAEMTMSKLPPNMSPVEYRQSLWLEALECYSKIDDSMLMGTFKEDLHQSIHHRLRAYWGSRKTAKLQELAPYATLLRSFQSGSASPALTSSPTRT